MEHATIDIRPGLQGDGRRFALLVVLNVLRRGYGGAIAWVVGAIGGLTALSGIVVAVSIYEALMASRR